MFRPYSPLKGLGRQRAVEASIWLYATINLSTFQSLKEEGKGEPERIMEIKKSLNKDKSIFPSTQFVVILVSICLFIFYGYMDAEGADWRYFLFNDDSKMTYYYDEESLNFPTPGNVRVWIKTVDKYEDYKKCLIELNCKDRMFTFLAIISYNKENRIKEGYTYPTEWKFFPSGSMLYALSTIVCP